MSAYTFVKNIAGRMFNFKSDAEKAFNVDESVSSVMDANIALWGKIVSGAPPWVDNQDNIDTINFASFLCSDIAKKVCLDIDINVTGSERADYLQSVTNALKTVIRDKVEDAAGIGGIMFKPNGSSSINNCIDYVKNGDFIVTEADGNGNILGAIFRDYIQQGKKYYTRLEWHRFKGDVYIISNKAFVSDNENVLGREISIQSVPQWKDLQPDIYVGNIDKPLFAYFKLPYNNVIDGNSPLGVAAFANAITELKDLDIAWSRKSLEVEDSKHLTFADTSMIQSSKFFKIKLPRFIKTYDPGTGHEDKIHEHVATLLTEQRITDINSILSLISTKCGYSQGQFVLDRKTGAITATQVEADDQETIRTIKDIRDALRDCMDNLLYAINVYADLYNMTPAGRYKTDYAFGDLTYNWEEDRVRHWQYVQQGKYPLWRYYVKFEGMSEKEAKAVVEEAKKENDTGGSSIFNEE